MQTGANCQNYFRNSAWGNNWVLQPLDVVINKPFKDLLKKLYVSWLINQVNAELENSSTTAGYLKAPTVESLIEWVKEASKKIDASLIFTAFEKTAITNPKRIPEIYEKLEINMKQLIEK